MKVLVCGGRGYSSWTTVGATLNRIHAETPINLVISGGAKGADRLGEKWASLNDVETYMLPADWEQHGKAAGPIRNAEMLRLNPDLVVAFPGGSGTANMIKIARAAGVKVERAA